MFANIEEEESRFYSYDVHHQSRRKKANVYRTFVKKQTLGRELVFRKFKNFKKIIKFII